MKRINTTEISLVIIVMVIGVIINIFSSYYVKIVDTSLIDNKFYSSNAKGINISTEEKVEIIKEEKDFILYKSLSNGGQQYDIREIYYKGEVHIPPMIKGEFLVEDNFSKDEGKAVIGREVSENIIEENGKNYFNFYDKRYEVVGIMGGSRPSDLDTMVFLTMESSTNFDGVYFVDGKNEGDVNRVREKLMNISNGKGREIELEKGVMSLGVNFLIIYSLTILSLVCSTILLLYYYVEKEKKKIAIKKLCGFSNKRLVKETIVRQVFIVTVGFILGTVAFILLKDLFELKSVSIFNLILSYVIVVIGNIGILLITIRNIIKIDTSILLK